MSRLRGASPQISFGLSYGMKGNNSFRSLYEEIFNSQVVYIFEDVFIFEHVLISDVVSNFKFLMLDFYCFFETTRVPGLL